MTNLDDSILKKQSILQRQVEIGKAVLPDTRHLKVSVLRVVYDALQAVATHEKQPVDVIAANVLSGWVCQAQDEYDAASQKSDAER